MPDPLSIAAGVVGLLEVTGSIASELRKFHRGSALINTTISELQYDVEGLQRVLESMRHTFTIITAANQVDTGHVGSLWSNVSRSITDGKDILGRLQTQIQSIKKETKLLDDQRKQLRLNRAQPQIAEFRVHIQSFKDGLGLSLQAIILWNQETHQQAASQVLPNLSELHNEVRRIALELNQKIDLLETRVHQRQDKDIEIGVKAMQNLKECVRSAASTISSASTVRVPNRDSVPLGDLDSVKDHVRRWMESHTPYGYHDDERTVRARSVADVLPLGRSGDDTDSDAELETEITKAMMRSGQQKSNGGDTNAAIRMLHKCLQRLDCRDFRCDSISLAMELEVLEELYSIYFTQNDWILAQKICLRKLQLHKLYGSQVNSNFINDVLRLAEVNTRKGDLIDAELHARRALKEARKIESTDGIAAALGVLITISEAQEDRGADEAYNDMLGGTTREDSLRSVSNTQDPSKPVLGKASCSFEETNYTLKEPRSTPSDHLNPSPSPPDLAVPNRSIEDWGLRRQHAIRIIAAESFVMTNVGLDPQKEHSRSSKSDTSLSVSDRGLNIDTVASPDSVNGQEIKPQNQAQHEPMRHPLSGKSDFTSQAGLEVVAEAPRKLGEVWFSITAKLSPRSPAGQELADNKAAFPSASAEPIKIILNADCFGFMMAWFARAPKHGQVESMYGDEDKYSMSRSVGERSVVIDIGEGGSDDVSSNRVEQLPWDNYDVLLIGFSIVDHASFRAIPNTKCSDKVRLHPWYSPMILVGVEQELRDDPSRSSVTRLEAEEMRKRIFARAYIECSAVTGYGMSQLWEAIARGAPHERRRKAKQEQERREAWYDKYWV